jgi:hypothetical protein
MPVAFLVDGFNVYHSLKAAEKQAGKGPLRWLDLHGLCATLVSSAFGRSATLESVHYFSAFAAHLETRSPEVTRRHRTYVEALKSTGVRVTLRRFKRKTRSEWLSRSRLSVRFGRVRFRLPIPWIQVSFATHEEKETDVAIACELLRLLQTGACDCVVLVTGDTDLAPAVRTAAALFPKALVAVAFPYQRFNKELDQLATRSIKIGVALYETHQLPPFVTLRSGRVLQKPASW